MKTDVKARTRAGILFDQRVSKTLAPVARACSANENHGRAARATKDNGLRLNAASDLPAAVSDLHSDFDIRNSDFDIRISDFPHVRP
ncbi:MAG TPA: hypothetical protein VFC78_07125 [Tepidisphaeraceae bacterium]|nr:hypothetical protein [Tepidisphaeraceae bacterium]